MNNRAITAILLLLLSLSVNAQVVINEFQSSNSSTIADSYGDYPDWIELYNTSATDLNLEGWSISDDPLVPDKWIFSDITIPANGFLLLYASGRDIKMQPAVWDTKVDLGDEWTYVIPGSNIDNWTAPGFDDSSWSIGNSGFGYSDGDDNTEVPADVSTIYLRTKFTIASSQAILNMLLHVDYDDGFVAYLNGVEVARSGLTGSPVNYNDYAISHEASIYSGGAPEEFDISAHKGLLIDGENTLAVEVHNAGATSSDLTIIPFLSLSKTTSDGSESTSSYLNLGNQSSHTNFKLSSAGDPILLTKPDGSLSDKMDSVVSRVDISYGILAKTGQKVYFSNPTPGYDNDTIGYMLFDNDVVNFSNDGGFIDGTIALGISSPVSSNIYYTTDGSEPDITSQKYDQAFFVNSTSTIRARIIEEGFLPGLIYSVSFINGRKPDLPVISLTTEDENLWDYNTGMYAMGPNASGNVPYFGANFWMDWEYPFSFVYIDKNGRPMVTQDIGAKIFGGWSRANNQKSFALFARKEYGKKSLDHKFFENNSLTEFKSLVLRNSGNDWRRTMFKDGFITSLTSHLGIEHQSFQPVATYINGEYWGLYNLREKVNEDFLAAHYNLNADEISILQNEADIVEGSNTSYVQLLNYLNGNSSLADDTKFNYVDNLIDVDNYIKYQLVNIYVGNTDWPGNNIKYWRSGDPTSKWRWIMYDTDFGFGGYDDVYHPTLEFATATSAWSWANPPWATLVLRRMLTNIGFRNDFINQMADNINTTFLPSNVIAQIDSLQNNVQNEIPYQVDRWGSSYSNWEYEVENLRQYGEERSGFMRNHIEDFFNLPDQHTIYLNVSSNLHGRIRVNTIQPSKYPFSGIYFETVPIEIEAIPEPGFKFVEWEGTGLSDRILTIELTANSQYNAVFEELSDEDVELVINEINYNSGENFDSGDWIELYNPTDATLNIGGFELSEVNDTVFMIPNGTIIPAGGFVVIAKNIDKFNAVYPEVENVISGLSFGLSSSGDELRLHNSNGVVLDGVDYLPYRPWPENANGMGYTLELKSPELNNGIADNWKSDYSGGTPGIANSGSTSVDQVISVSNVSVDVFPTRFRDYVTIQVVTEENYNNISLEIVHVNGQVVHSITKSNLGNVFEYNWQPESSVSSGVYFVNIKSNNQVHNSKIIYLK